MLPGISTPENQDIAVYFDAPADFRLTMDGLDVISLPKIEKIEGESYIKPMGRSHAPLLLLKERIFLWYRDIMLLQFQVAVRHGMASLKLLLNLWENKVGKICEMNW